MTIEERKNIILAKIEEMKAAGDLALEELDLAYKEGVNSV